MVIFKVIICIVIGYFFGNISTSYLVGKKYDMDIRKHGSGNAGATNVLRVVGKKAAIITFFGDALKAVFAIYLVRYLLYPADDMGTILSLYTGIGVVLGHNYPFWLQGKGGKGIAATGGVMFAMDIRLALIAIVVFVVVVALTKYVSVASLTISLLLPIWLMIRYPGQTYVHILGWIFAIFAFYRHLENIKRLIKGTENKVVKKEKEIDNSHLKKGE